MEIKAALLDFDGTLVTEDLLDVLCELTGKRQLSAELNLAFHNGQMDGREALTRRISLLSGLSLEDVHKKLNDNLYLREGSEELLKFFSDRGIKTILDSGQIIPVLQFYQRRLNIDYVVGTQLDTREGIIYGLSKEHSLKPSFKLDGCKAILDKLSIAPGQVVAFGDSLADKNVFEYAALSIAVSPVKGIERYADYIIRHDLKEAIPILEKEMD